MRSLWNKFGKYLPEAIGYFVAITALSGSADAATIVLTYDAVGTTTFDSVDGPDGVIDRTVTSNPDQKAELRFTFDPAKMNYTSTSTSHAFSSSPTSASDGVTAELLLDGVVAQTIDYSRAPALTTPTRNTTWRMRGSIRRSPRSPIDRT